MPGNQSKAPLALVTGATGALGPSVVEALRGAGYAVRTLSLDAPGPELLPASIDVRLGDITDASAVRSAMDGAAVVVHMAALLHIANPAPELRLQYERVNAGGTRVVVESAQAAGVRRLVFFSTIAVYGRGGGQLLDEDSPPRPDTYYAETKAAAERIVLSAELADGRPLGVVLRPAAAYGARIKGNYRQLVRALARGRFIPIGSGRNRRTLIYDKDLARSTVLAIEHPAAAGQCFNVSDGQCHKLRDIVAAICLALDRTPPRLSLPVGPVRLAAGLTGDAVRFIGRRSPVTRATIDKYTEDIAVSSERIRSRLGFVPQYDLAAGWRETIEEMRRRGDL